MFLDELTPIFREFTKHPVSFAGGFVSGILRISLTDDPVRSWLAQQTGTNVTDFPTEANNGKGGGPQTISIE